MIRITRNKSITLTLLLALGATGCATTGNNPGAGNTSAATDFPDVQYEVKSGDSLALIAKRLTGDLNNWKAIAENNDISDPRKLAVGDIITIPNTLIQGAEQEQPQEDTQPNVIDMQLTPSSSTPLPVTTGSGVSIARSVSDTDDTIAPITVTPVEVNRSFELEPIEHQSLTDADANSSGSEALKIIVSGTYFPKGIYDEPANYARLVSRVAPGTIFELESEINDWYKIRTAEGFGYIRRTDSARLD